ncbi:MAG: RNA polymerase-associated protein RapA [Endozoicomonadaceae bacterium]|nr:RNA polymerase-associated protein RapA [Endozoicomonadaceae bacterium]
MPTFVSGQRWISDTEVEQGLGTILTIEAGTVTLFYPATGETRVYRQENCPLSRVMFAVGDTIESYEGWSLTVTEVNVGEESGLITYSGTLENGERRDLPESCLSNFIAFNKPQDRLLAGQIDLNSHFSLRYQSLYYYRRVIESPLLGLTGARASLIPHQLHIAKEVGCRFAPRVLLADEVGLGKTIEAGLILNQQLLTGQARRILIVLPEPLVHQWLVEMLRRFHLHFSVFDEERCRNADGENPFSSEQLILTSLEFLCNHFEYQQQVVDAGWDLLVVDEAHHLLWSESEGGSLEYQVVESLAHCTPSVLLLTATPEQLGVESHFARLRLLDPDRFHDLKQFREESAGYEPLANAVQQLLEAEQLPAEQAEVIAQLVGEEAEPLLTTLTAENRDQDDYDQAKEQMIRLLLDRHGTGRILFRNTRLSVPGFPGRAVQAYPQPLPELYKMALKASHGSDEMLKHQLFPELAYQANMHADDNREPWWKIDPRVQWLSSLLKQLKRQKVLLICANATTAMDLEATLRISSGTHASVFHEEMSIIERDRAAAWFADEEYGAQLLICSEIGSEGRNFQFSHHLVLFDLPFNPDLLEQRIGRLDRIGQSETISIHVPYLEETGQARLFHWYHEGLDAFADTCPAGSVVFAQLGEELTEWLNYANTAKTENNGEATSNDLISRTLALNTEIASNLRQGRDRLLEMNSRGVGIRHDLAEEIRQQDTPEILQTHLERLLEGFGLETEDHSKHCLIVRPSSHMTISSYPAVPVDGTTITLNRDTALAREDMQFVTWEHPMIREGMEMLLISETGNTAVALIKNSALKFGTMLMEAVFVVEVFGDRKLQLHRFLPSTVIRTLIDPNFKNLADKVSFEALDDQLQKIKTAMARKLVKTQRESIVKMVAKAEDYAKSRVTDIIDEACQQILQTVTREMQRLTALKVVNPNIRDEEIEFLKQQADVGYQCLQKAQLRLDGIRLIFAA